MNPSDISPNILVKHSDAILDIEISRRDKKNALNTQMYRSINALLQDAQENPSINVVFLHGQDDLFTSGNDLKEFLNLDIREGSAALEFLRVIANFKKPLVASVGGDAIGIGTTLLLHCDIAIASQDARFQMPFVNLGVSPEGGSSYMLPAISGQKLSNELLMLGEAFDANKALRAGIINDFYPANEIIERGYEICKKLASKPQDALRTTKSLIKSHHVQELGQALHAEFEQFVRLLQTAPSREIMTAFIEKRMPNQAIFNQIENIK
jgi:enoyl-CoA hydratase/carnithine racemase